MKNHEACKACELDNDCAHQWYDEPEVCLDVQQWEIEWAEENDNACAHCSGLNGICKCNNPPKN